MGFSLPLLLRAACCALSLALHPSPPDARAPVTVPTLRPSPTASAGPWEHLFFGVFGGAYFAHLVLRGEEYYEGLTQKLVREKMARNQGVLDDKYRAMLGDKYAD